MDERLAKVLSNYEYEEKMTQGIKKAYLLVKNGLYDEEDIQNISGIFAEIKFLKRENHRGGIANNVRYMSRISDGKICIVKENDINSTVITGQKYSVKVPITITNENYEKLKKCENNKSNSVGDALKTFSVVLYVLSGFVLIFGVLLADGEMLGMAAAILGAFHTVLLGLLVHGFSIVVENTTKINDKI